MNELYHYGVKGQQWGVRNYQNYDGSLTTAGKQRYDSDNRPASRQRNITGTGKSVSKGNAVQTSQNEVKTDRPQSRQKNISGMGKEVVKGRPVDYRRSRLLKLESTPVDNASSSRMTDAYASALPSFFEDNMNMVGEWYTDQIPKDAVNGTWVNLISALKLMEMGKAKPGNFVGVNLTETELEYKNFQKQIRKSTSAYKKYETSKRLNGKTQSSQNSGFSKENRNKKGSSAYKKYETSKRLHNKTQSSQNSGFSTENRNKKGSSAYKKYETSKRLHHSDELYHYGILGMHWGIRRYQNPDGSLTEAGKKRYGTAENLAAGRTKKQAEKYEKDKQKAIKSGNAKEISKYSKDLTQEEMTEAVKRINNEQLLSDLRMKEFAASQEKINKIISTGTTVKNALVLSKEVYNLTAQIYNAANKDGKKMPIIGEESKTVNPSDQRTLYKLNKDKAADERSKWFNNELQNHGPDYFKKNASKFTTEELKEVQNRFDQMDSMFGSSKSSSENSSQSSSQSSSESKSKTGVIGQRWGVRNRKNEDQTVDTINWPSTSDVKSSWRDQTVDTIKWPSTSDVKSSWREDTNSISVSDTSDAQDWLMRYMGR